MFELPIFTNNYKNIILFSLCFLFEIFYIHEMVKVILWLHCLQNKSLKKKLRDISLKKHC